MTRKAVLWFVATGCAVAIAAAVGWIPLAYGISSLADQAVPSWYRTVVIAREVVSRG